MLYRDERNCIAPFNLAQSVVAFHSKEIMCLSCTVSDIFSIEQWREFEMWFMGHSKLLNMAPIDRRYKTYY